MGCSKFFGWDEDMICPETGAKPLCNTSDLNEELGQVEYLFTDKTGTLTDNDLVFRICSIGGVKYEYSESNKLKIIKEDPKNSLEIVDESLYNGFLEALAICHTVRVLPGSGEDGLKYQASSLDEEM